MTEQLIVRASEIILASAAVAGIFIVLTATWRELRDIASKKQLKITGIDFTRQDQTIIADYTISDLPQLFLRLSGNLIDKAIIRHKPYDKTSVLFVVRYVLARSSKPRTRKVSTGTIVTIHSKIYRFRLLVISIGLLIAIGLLSYFFYTAATLRSNTLLALSWMLVSSWLVALIWSDEHLTFTTKSKLSFTIPFMYFVFYVQAFIQLASNIRKLASGMRMPKRSFQDMYDTLYIEMYSTRY
jgi:hypothetical protein